MRRGCLLRPAFDYTDISRLTFPGFFVRRYDNLHEAKQQRLYFSNGLPSNKWVEVMRIARLDIAGPPLLEEIPTCASGQIWMWLAPGSGIWWNTGRTKVLTGVQRSLNIWNEHSYRVDHQMPCETARREGYDSLQITEFENAYSFELLDCRGALRQDARTRWEVACPPEHVPLRMGLPLAAERHAPALNGIEGGGLRECACNTRLAHISCST